MQDTTVQLNTVDVVRCCLGNAGGKPSRCDIHHENLLHVENIKVAEHSFGSL